jgi:hypothetical protein
MNPYNNPPPSGISNEGYMGFSLKQLAELSRPDEPWWKDIFTTSELIVIGFSIIKGLILYYN